MADLPAAPRARCLCLDIETARQDRMVLRELGVFRPDLDTRLKLSPVAFSQNPYHRLVKDYKLCTTTRNDPVRDAELAYALFADQNEAL